MSLVTNRTSIIHEVEKFLWENDFFTYILYQLDIFDELKGCYNLGYLQVILYVFLTDLFDINSFYLRFLIGYRA
jgi:hypothetical protein